MPKPRTVTISLPPDLASQVDAAADREGRTRSEFFREAARQYLHKQERWAQLFSYGERAAESVGIAAEDQVAAIVTERRRGQRAR